ncbi:MAG: aldo/keto reductase [Verrucomicrobiota bacterium]
MKSSTSRRSFLKSSVAVPAALVAGQTNAKAEETTSKPNSTAVPTRKLGRNGPEVGMLSMGGLVKDHSPEYLELAWQRGIRYFDTALRYRRGESEQNVGAWIKKYPERRKDLFLVTKDPAAKGPELMLDSIDGRLEVLNTNYIDLYFLHGIGTKEHGKGSLEWPKSDRFRKVCEKLKESGKTKLVGFSCHDDALLEYLNAAADGGFVDAIMLQYNTFFKKGDAFDQALDRCYDKGIGLISMKEMRPFANMPKQHPELEKKGLTSHQTLLQSVWSDERISSICSAMETEQEIIENTEAARTYEKIEESARNALQEIAMVPALPMCPGCGPCRELSPKMQYAFMDVSRYVNYYEKDGDTSARDLYANLPEEAKRYDQAELESLRDLCEFRVDYPEIAKRAKRYFIA